MKNSINIIFILLALPFVGFGQSDVDNSKRLSVGFNYEINTGFRQLNYTGINEEIGNVRNESETPKLGFTTGLNIRYQFTPKITADLGFLFANKGMQVKQLDINWAVNTSNAPNYADIDYVFKSFVIPLKVNYQFKTAEKWNVYATTGAALNFFMLRNTIYTTYKDEVIFSENKNIQRDGFRKITHSVLLGIGVNYELTNKITLNVEPIYRRYISSISLQESGKEYLYSTGINAVVLFNFGN